METSREIAVTWEVALPVANASRCRTRINSQPVGWPSAANAGLMRSACHSSHRARSTAASVSSRPSVSRATEAVSVPSWSSAFHNSSTSGETLWPEDFCGACFQSASARRERMKGSASLWATKSGCSLTVPNRFRATTSPEATRRVSNSCACSMAAGPGVA
jgi:hypothetical protein